MASHRILQNFSKFSSLAKQTAVIRVNHEGRILQNAFISTSKKNRDTTTVAGDATIVGQKVVTPPKTVEDFRNPNKALYQDFGFVPKDRDWDINIRNYTMFFTVTIGMVGTGFILMYYPDHRLRDWHHREAFIELARREALGLPHVDPNLVPVENIVLPSDEELGDYDIII